MKKLLAGIGAAMSLTACGTTACVARGSHVSTPLGPRRIEELGEGDEVIVVDAATCATAVSRIVGVRSSTRECGTLESAGASLLLTSDHPVFDPEAGDFFPAGDWLVGKRSHVLRLTAEGIVERAAIDARAVFTRVEQVFDLSVDHAWHTFVAEGVVVHNKLPLDCAIPGGGTTNLGDPDPPPCTCTDAQPGRWTCTRSGGTAVCSLCGISINDAGP